MILGHRLSELCGHGPSLETDIACTNISLDLFGEVRSYFQYAAERKGGDASEDSIAYLRNEREMCNPILVELENKHFGYVIARQFLFDVYHLLLVQALKESSDERISAIAHKSEKEAKYHFHFSSEWVKRLGDGTTESHTKMQEAISDLYPYCHELFTSTQVELKATESGIGPDLKVLEKTYYSMVHEVLDAATMQYDSSQRRFAKGKTGIHTECMGKILPEFQYMQRAYPNMTW